MSSVPYAMTERVAAARREDTQKAHAGDPMDLALGRVLELFSGGK